LIIPAAGIGGFAMFSPDQIPRPAGPPASSSPLRDYLGGAHPGVNGDYVVLPRVLVESMSLPWQQQLTYLLAEFHQAVGHLDWPLYRVVPSRHEKLADLDEDQLAEVGAMVEIDGDGELVYRERSGRRIADPDGADVLVSCADPLPAQVVMPAPPAAPPGPPHGSFPPSGPPVGPPVPPLPAPPEPPRRRRHAAPSGRRGRNRPAAEPEPPLYAPPPGVTPEFEPDPQPDYGDYPDYGDFGPQGEPPTQPRRW
jgi:hypothetical protein